MRRLDRSFTLFHELAHLLFHTSGIDRNEQTTILNEFLGVSTRRIEHRMQCIWLNGNTLVPDEFFDEIFDEFFQRTPRRFDRSDPRQSSSKRVSRQFQCEP